MQGARGGGEGAARAGVDAGGEEIDWGIFVFVGAASAICAEPGGRGSGQAGYGGGAGQIEFIARAAECGGGGGFGAGGGGKLRGGGEKKPGGAGGGLGVGSGARTVTSRDVRHYGGV